MIHQNLTLWQIYFLALGNGSQTDASAEQEMFVSVESGREPRRSPSPPHLPGQIGVFPLLQNFPQEGSSPTMALMQTLETFLPLGRQPVDPLPDDSSSQVEGGRGSQGQGRKQDS